MVGHRVVQPVVEEEEVAPKMLAPQLLEVECLGEGRGFIDSTVLHEFVHHGAEDRVAIRKLNKLVGHQERIVPASAQA